MRHWKIKWCLVRERIHRTQHVRRFRIFITQSIIQLIHILCHKEFDLLHSSFNCCDTRTHQSVAQTPDLADRTNRWIKWAYKTTIEPNHMRWQIIIQREGETGKIKKNNCKWAKFSGWIKPKKKCKINTYSPQSGRLTFLSCIHSFSRFSRASEQPTASSHGCRNKQMVVVRNALSAFAFGKAIPKRCGCQFLMEAPAFSLTTQTQNSKWCFVNEETRSSQCQIHLRIKNTVLREWGSTMLNIKRVPIHYKTKNKNKITLHFRLSMDARARAHKYMRSILMINSVFQHHNDRRLTAWPDTSNSKRK